MKICALHSVLILGKFLHIGAIVFFLMQNVLISALPQDREIADIHVNTFLDIEHQPESRALLYSALEFNPEHGDALVLLAGHRQTTPRQAVELLERALKADTWHFFSQNDAAVRLFGLYCRLRSYSKAGILLGGYEIDFFTDPQYALQLAQYYTHTGEIDSYRQTVRRGYRLWHEHFTGHMVIVDSAFRNVLIQRLTEYPDFIPLLSAMEALLDYLDHNTKERVILLERYVASGLFSPVLQAYSVLQGLLDVEALTAVLPYGDVIQAIWPDNKMTEDIRTEIITMYLEFSGEIHFDRYGDGFIQDTIIYQDGRIEYYLSDYNQDGQNNIELGFDGSLHSLVYRFDTETWIITYDSYPWVESIRQKNDVDLLYRIDLLDFRPGDFPAETFLPIDFHAIDSNILNHLSQDHNIAVIDFSASTDSALVLPSGYHARSEEDRLIESWDVDGSGHPDIILTSFLDSTRQILEIFDYILIMEEYRPVSLSYSGRDLAIRQTGHIVWIDIDPLGIDSMPDGFFSQNGQLYHAFTYNNLVFVQKIGQ